MAETTVLERQWTRKGLVGSNPPPSSTSYTTAIGKAGEHLVIVDLLSRGLEAFLSVAEGSETDIVISTGNGFKRLQVKTASTSSDGRVGLNVYKQTIHRSGSSTPKVHNYLESGVIDIFAVAVLDRRVVIYVSATELRTTGIKNSVTFRFESTQQKKHVRLVEDYTLERALTYMQA